MQIDWFKRRAANTSVQSSTFRFNTCVKHDRTDRSVVWPMYCGQLRRLQLIATLNNVIRTLNKHWKLVISIKNVAVFLFYTYSMDSCV